MCGIVGAIAQRDVSPILLEGLRRLEYRGYDSAGMAVLNGTNQLDRVRILGKVNELAHSLEQHPLPGANGIAHTRWATHGKPSVNNAHPHMHRDARADTPRQFPVRSGVIKRYEFRARTG